MSSFFLSSYFLPIIFYTCMYSYLAWQGHSATISIKFVFFVSVKFHKMVKKVEVNLATLIIMDTT